MYEEIIEERKKPDADEAKLNQKSTELLAVKSEVLNGYNDINNYLAGIELNIDENKAKEHLFYGRDISDKIINGLVDELKFYDPDDGVIKGVNDKINDLVKNYNDAKTAKEEAEKALAKINQDIANNQLTTEEQANAQNIANAEQEKQRREAEKQQLENDKQAAEVALAKAQNDLAASGFANLGKNSYAQGHQAFASGNDSIAIGTSAIATQTNAIAIGHNATVNAVSAIALGNSAQVAQNADKGVAIGDGATVKHTNSVAIGAGSTTSSGAKDSYNAPLGGDRTKAVPQGKGAAGEFSVGSEGNLRKITHVAAGESDTDVVTVWQLKEAIAAIPRADMPTTPNPVVPTPTPAPTPTPVPVPTPAPEPVILVKQEPSNAPVNNNPITVGKTTGGTEVDFRNKNAESRRLIGVAAGVNATDAVNKSQLDQAIGQVNNRIDQVDGRINQVDKRINQVDKTAKAGTANAIAVASMPQAYAPSQNVFSVGTGNYKGANALAVGLSRVSDNGKVIIKLNGSVSDKDNMSVGAGIGFAW
ncbi:YadA-like family protein [Ursidibacter arcticus]